VFYFLILRVHENIYGNPFVLYIIIYLHFLFDDKYWCLKDFLF